MYGGEQLTYCELWPAIKIPTDIPRIMLSDNVPENRALFPLTALESHSDIVEEGVEGGTYGERVCGASGIRAPLDDPARQGSFIASSILDNDSTDAGQGEREEQKHDPAREPPVLNAITLKSDKEAILGSCEEHSASAIESLEL